MTYTETAVAMRRLADVIDGVVRDMGKDVDTGRPKPMLEGEAAVGGAALLCFIRDLVTASPNETYDRATLLVILETLSRDAELFPCGVGQIMWDSEP